MYRLPRETALPEFLETLSMANKLIRLGARPPVVQHLCGIGRKVAIRLYKENHNSPSKSGMLPYDSNWIARSSMHALHASIFLGIFADIAELVCQNPAHATRFITAYGLYREIVGRVSNHNRVIVSTDQDNLLVINRAWHLIQQFNSRESRLVLCATCQSRHIVLNTLPKFYQRCPICEVWAEKNIRRHKSACLGWQPTPATDSRLSTS
jgi:flagellar transcriptional activator FlhC